MTQFQHNCRAIAAGCFFALSAAGLLAVRLGWFG